MNLTFWSQARLGFHLSRAELAKRNATTIGGLFWTFVTPAITILTIWFALDFGLGMRASAGAGYGQALVAGLAAWLFVSDAITSSAQSIVSNPHFVKKVRFPVGLLPVSCVLAALAIHLVIVLVVVLILAIQGLVPGWELLSFPLWLALALVVALSFGLLTSALTVVSPDVGAILPSIISLLFWLSPIVWPMSMVAEQYRWIVLLNPIAIIVEGYRYALTGTPLAIAQGTMALTIVCIAAFFALCLLLFQRMRPLFADML